MKPSLIALCSANIFSSLTLPFFIPGKHYIKYYVLILCGQFVLTYLLGEICWYLHL